MTFDDGDCFSMDFDGNGFKRDPVRVYLAGPLTNVDEMAQRACCETRDSMIEVLRGFSAEHFDVYDPGDHTPPGTIHSADEVFKIDYLATVTADVVIFNMSFPSHGVGIEALLNASAGSPRIVVCQSNTTVSRMFSGLFNPTLATIQFADQDELKTKLNHVLPDILPAIRRSMSHRRPVYEDCMRAALGKFVLSQRILHGITIDELANRTDILRHWLVSLERNDIIAAGLSQAQLGRLAHALDSEVICEGLTSRLKARNAHEDEIDRNSRNSLVDFVRTTDRWVQDSTLFSMWAEFKDAREAVRGRQDINQTWTALMWRQLYLRLIHDGRGLFD